MIPPQTSGKTAEVSASPDKQALKRESKRLIRAAGGVEAAAMFARPNKTAMGEYGSQNTDRFMPVDAIADLEAVTRGTAGWPIMTRMLAAMSSCAVVELPQADALQTDWFKQIGCLASDNGKIAEALCDAAADGVVTAEEVLTKRLIALCDDQILHTVNLRARLERIVEEGQTA